MQFSLQKCFFISLLDFFLDTCQYKINKIKHFKNKNFENFLNIIVHQIEKGKALRLGMYEGKMREQGENRDGNSD